MHTTMQAIIWNVSMQSKHSECAKGKEYLTFMSGSYDENCI